MILSDLEKKLAWYRSDFASLFEQEPRVYNENEMKLTRMYKKIVRKKKRA